MFTAIRGIFFRFFVIVYVCVCCDKDTAVAAQTHWQKDMVSADVCRERMKGNKDKFKKFKSLFSFLLLPSTSAAERNACKELRLLYVR